MPPEKPAHPIGFAVCGNVRATTGLKKRLKRK
jgi:hypothetical protein